VGHGCLLDSRRALVHESQGWLAVADVHYGFELNRARNHGALLPQWGMAATEKRLLDLLDHYKPRTLIMNGDVMDGGGSIREAERFIARLRDCVAELVLVIGNHDRPVLKREQQFVHYHEAGDLVFHHGHKFPKMRSELAHLSVRVHVCGHEHPALSLNDGAGLRLKLPALVQEQLHDSPDLQHWILPAFSPWAGGARYESRNQRLATWGCADGHILPDVI
jgi:putative SbcD/Mre11-related phosphoesterase